MPSSACLAQNSRFLLPHCPRRCCSPVGGASSARRDHQDFALWRVRAADLFGLFAPGWAERGLTSPQPSRLHLFLLMTLAMSASA